MKTYLILILAIVFASCSATHKIKTETHKTVDSVVNTVKDTVNVSKEVNQANNFTAKGIDITFDYNKDEPIDTSGGDTVKWKPFYYKSTKAGSTDPMFNIIKDAVSNSGLTSRIPSSVTIHIDSLGQSSVINTKNDSSVGKQTTNAQVKTTDDEKSKTVTRTGLGAGAYLIIGIVVLLGLVALAIKFKWF